MNYSLPKEQKEQILELKKTMDKVNLDDLSFEYTENPYGDIEISIRHFKEHWEVSVVNEKNDYRYLDLYKIIDNDVIYQYTETDKL